MTYSMLGFCRRTGEIGLAAATISVAVGARLGQRVVSGAREWIIASQAISRPGLGFEAGDLLGRGVPYDALATTLARNDPGLPWRQLAILENGAASFVLNGDHAEPWRGHVALADGVAVGNYLAGARVVDAMAAAYAGAADASLAERLVRALEAGRGAGGQADRAGTPMPELSAFVRVFGREADRFVYGDGRSPVLDLRVDFDLDPIGRLRGLFDDCQPLRASYELRARDPEAYLRQTSFFELDLAERHRAASPSPIGQTTPR
jgi:uncharacterized Ntn-hydrolase superfamily protein